MWKENWCVWEILVKYSAFEGFTACRSCQETQSVCFLFADDVLFCASKQMWPKTDQSTRDRSCGEPIGGSYVCASLPLDSPGRLERPIQCCCGGEGWTTCGLLCGLKRCFEKQRKRFMKRFPDSTFMPQPVQNWELINEPNITWSARSV